MEQKPRIHPAVATLIVVVLVGIVTTVAIVVNGGKESTSTSSTTTTQSSNDTTTATASTDTSQYADGIYSATGSYVTPGGTESIELTVTIKDGVITATSLAQNATDRESRQYQAAFAGGYESLVVGKNVDEVSLSRVAGSSLTSNGFNSALEQIKTDAAA